MRLKFCRAPPRTRGLTTSRSIVQRKDWLALVAVHSDAWLMAVAFYYGAKFDGKERCEKRRLQASRRLVFHRFVALRGNSSPLGPPASELTVVEPPNRARREKLFKHINSLPTVYEILSGKAVNKPKAKAKGAAAGQVPPLFPQFPHCQRCAFPGGGAGTLVARLRCRRDLFEPSAAASMSTKGVQNPNSSRSSLEHTAAPPHDRRLRLPSLRCA